MACCGINTSARHGARSTKVLSAKCMRTAFRSPKASPSLTSMTSTRSAPSVYYEYAKDICENYRMDLRRYKLIRERKQYIGISNRETYQAMCEALAFAQQSLKTALNDYANLFRKRFSEGLSIRKTADAMQQNRGVIERRQAALYRAFAQLLQQWDEADGVCRLMQKTEYDQRDIGDLLE